MKLSSIKETYFTPAISDGSRVNNFNIIRFVAAILVLYGHMAHLMEVPVTMFLGQEVSSIGVKTFFIISGYLITKSYLKDSNFLRYMVRRCFRIFPGLIAVTLLTVLVIGGVMSELPFFDYILNPGTRLYIRNMFLYPIYNLPGVFVNGYPLNGAINGSLWSLPVEFAAYLLLPVTVIIFKKLKCLKSGIFACAVIFLAASVLKMIYMPAARYVLYGTNWFDGLVLIPYFFIGALYSFPEAKKYLNVQLGAALFIFAAFFSFSYEISEVIIAIVLPYFIFSFALAPNPFFGNWFSKCDFSYGIYLYSFPVQQVVYHQLKKFFAPSLNIASLICFVVSLVCAVFSWYVVEKPAQNLGKFILKKLEPKKAQRKE